MRSRPRTLLVVATAGVACAGYGSLPEGARAASVNAKEFAQCRTITPDAERLACYDRLALNNATAERTPPSLPPDATPAAAQSFGMVKPPAAKAPEPSRMEARVLGITTDSRGTSVVKLDNDQSWTVEDGSAMLQAGDAIVIKRAALGSFQMMTPTKRVYRVRRLR